MNQKHTPGPWAAEFVIPQHSADGYWQIQSAQTSDGALMVADVCECPETDANARLIAAAPDMLAALEGFAAWEAADSLMNDDLRALFEQARTIIARAKGTP